MHPLRRDSVKLLEQWLPERYANIGNPPELEDDGRLPTAGRDGPKVTQPREAATDYASIRERVAEPSGMIRYDGFGEPTLRRALQ